MFGEKFTFELQRFTTTYSLTAGNDNYSNTFSDVITDAYSGNDSLYNYSGKNVSLSGGDGNDYIENLGAKATLIGGPGNDSILNFGVLVLDSYGNTLGNASSKVPGLIDGGAGDDYIFNINGANASAATGIYYKPSNIITISGGTGNDTIELSDTAEINLIVYNNGDGNDLIQAFNATSTLSISGSVYSSLQSASEIIVSVTLQGAATLSTDYIDGCIAADEEVTFLTEGNDSYSNTLDGASIQALGGFVSITYIVSFSLVDGTVGYDYISNHLGLGVSISGGIGYDYVNMGANGGKGGVYVYTGGNDTVLVDYWCLNTIVLGDVSVESSVRADDAHGTICLNNGKTLDVYPELGDWHVRVVSSMNEIPRVNTVIDSNENFVSYTGANQEGTIDLIAIGGAKVTINGDTSNYWILNTGSNGKITTGTGNDTVFNRGGHKSTISTGDGDDDISNASSNVSINSGSGDDFIENRDGNSNVTVNAGDGNDNIYDEWGENNSLIGGAGNDTINPGKNSTLYAGTGNDRVDLAILGTKVFLEDGDDTFTAYGDRAEEEGNATDYFVDGGAGDDFIKNIDGANLLITYTAGDGNDYIQGLNESSTLSISGSDYSTQVSGSDIIVSVTLQGAATLSTVNIAGEYVNPFLVTLTEGNDSYSNTLDGATIPALSGNDTNTNLGANATLFGNAGKDFISTYNSDGVSIDGGDDNDIIEVRGVAKGVTKTGGKGNDNIKLSGGNNLNQIAADGGNDTNTGFTKTDSLKNGGGTGTYSAEIDGSDIIVAVGTGKITLQGSANLSSNCINDAEISFVPEWTLDETTGTATYGTLNNTLITVTGVKSLDGISLKNNVVTLKEKSLNQTKVTISDGYTLALEDDVVLSESRSGGYVTADKTYYTAGKTEGYSFSDDGMTINYSAGTSKAFQLSGIKNNALISGFYVNTSNKTLAIGASAVDGKEVKLLNAPAGYKLATGNSLSKPETKTWTFDNSTATATYKDSYKTEGYALASNSKSITYSKATTPATLATIAGAKSKTGLTVNDEKITLKNSALLNKVTVGGTYEFDFAADYKNSTITGSSNADTITVRGSNISINADAGDDTINILGNADTVTITDYSYADDDIISLVSGSISNFVTSGNNYIFTIGSGKLTLLDAKGRYIHFVDSKKDDISAYAH